MKKYIVLFSLDTNGYMSIKNIKVTTKNYKEALTFNDEEEALNFLNETKIGLISCNLFNWCTRTFYKLK